MPEIKISYPKTEDNVNGIPLPKQLEFHTAPQKYRLFAGGFGTGKTLALGLEALKQMLIYPNNYGVIARKDLQELKATTLKDFFEICPENVIANHNRQDKVISFINGSQLYYMNLDSAREAERKIKSLNLGLVAIDQLEEISENIFLAFIGRLRRRDAGRCFIASCNPAGHDFVWRRWVECPYEQFCQIIELDKAKADGICEQINRNIETILVDSQDHTLKSGKYREEHIYGKFGLPPEIAKTLYEKYNYGCIEATTFDNPYLPPDYVDQLLKYPKNWVKRYVYCSWDDFEGLVFAEYLASRNKCGLYEPGPNEQRYIVMDYGYRNPTSIGFYSVDYDGNVRRYKEYYESGRQISDIVAYIKSNPEWEKAYRLADPSIWNVQRDGVSVGAEFALQGIYFERADNSVVQGIDKVNEYLRAGKLMICENCINMIREIGEYKWKAVKPGENRNEHEEPIKKNDHAMDELRYLVNYIYVPMKPDEKIPPTERTQAHKEGRGSRYYQIKTYGSDNLYSSYD